MDLYLSKPGVMSCAGNNIDELWKSVTTGNQSGIKKVTACDGLKYIAARVNEANLKPSGARHEMRIMRIENAALEQIKDDVEAVIQHYGADRVAVCVGSCDNGTELSMISHTKYFKEGAFPKEYTLEIQGADYAATFVAEKFGIKGPVNTFSTACSSSAGAIIKAAEIVMAGIADAVVAGGIDIASDTTLIGFSALEAVSSEITNPFSKNRHGITLGDGASFFVVSREPLSSEVASTGSTTVKLLGWGESSDAYHMTSPDPSGAGAQKAICRAIKSAGISASEVGYINLHGTGTKLNDSMEAKAVAAAMEGYNVPVSTTKTVTGHTLGAAAALEAAVCWKALVENNGKNDNIILPVQVWDGERDEDFSQLNIIDNKTNTNVKGPLKVCLSNSFAFGGANACLVLGV